MISVVLPTLNAQKRLGPCLAALAPGLVSGILREVIFADAGSTDDTVAIGEAVGARIVRGAPGAALAVAKGPWVLLLEPSTVLGEDWPVAVQHHAGGHPDKAGWFSLRRSGAGPLPWLDGLAANLAATLAGRSRPEHGLLLPPALWRAAPRDADHAALLRHARRQGLRGLGGRVVAPGR